MIAISSIKIYLKYGIHDWIYKLGNVGHVEQQRLFIQEKAKEKSIYSRLGPISNVLDKETSSN